jgi:hypothetical protein
MLEKTHPSLKERIQAGNNAFKLDVVASNASLCMGE